MDTGKVSTDEFKKILDDMLKTGESHTNLPLTHTVGVGAAFEWAIADLIARYEDRFPDPVDDACVGEWGGGNDLKCDLWFEDPVDQHILIVQAKYNKPGSTTKVGDFEGFCNAWQKHLNWEYVQQHGNDDIRDRLNGFKERLATSWSVEYRYVTNSKFNDRCRSDFSEAQESASNSPYSIDISYQDFSQFKDYYVQALSISRPIPKEARFNVRTNYFIDAKTDPYQSLVAVVKGNELRNLFLEHKQALYSYNVRGDLGKNSVNDAIRDTATNNPEDFFYFNNGVSALCTEMEVVGNQVTTKNFQIINGAQTVSSLVAAPENPIIDVLLRVIVTDSVETTEGFNAQVVKANNTQNVVKASDFRSNDRIQSFLEQNLANVTATGILPAFYYLPKRQKGKPKGKKGKALKMEALAKYRYAYLHDPIGVNKDVANLFKLKSEGPTGRYAKAFGVNGQVEAAWESQTLDECKFIYAVHEWLEKKTKALTAKNEKSRPLIAMRFHNLALIGSYIRKNRPPGEVSRLLQNEEDFNAVIGELYSKTQDAVLASLAKSQAAGDSLFGLRQSEKYWAEMCTFFGTLTVAGLVSDNRAKG